MSSFPLPTKMAASMTESVLQQIPTKKRAPPEIIVFKDPAKRRKSNKEKAKKKPLVKNKEKEREYLGKKVKMQLREARFQVRNYGIQGFSKEEKEEAKVQIAIQLGAKPPKRKAENYKILMEKIKLAKEAEKEKREEDRLNGIKRKKVVKTKPKEVVRGFTGLIGKFRDGVQKVPYKVIRGTNRK